MWRDDDHTVGYLAEKEPSQNTWNDVQAISSEPHVNTLEDREEKINQIKNEIMRDVVEHLSSVKGISSVFPLNPDLLSMIQAEESNIRCSGGITYENMALMECLRKNSALCMFCDGFLEEQREISMILVDDYGNITGNDVPKCKEEEYRSRKDVIWLSDNFIIYSKAEQKSESKMTILPRRFRTLDQIPGAKNAMYFYPTIGTDIMLKKTLMKDYDPTMCSIIVGFDTEPLYGKY